MALFSHRMASTAFVTPSGARSKGLFSVYVQQYGLSLYMCLAAWVVRLSWVCSWRQLPRNKSCNLGCGLCHGG